MKEIGEILPTAFLRHVQRVDSHVVDILAPLWPRVTGEAMARHCRPAAFSGGMLTLVTDCCTWSTQLLQMAEEIRAEINNFLGRPVVKKLRVQRVDRLNLIEMAQPKSNGSVAPQNHLRGSGRQRSHVPSQDCENY